MAGCPGSQDIIDEEDTLAIQGTSLWATGGRGNLSFFHVNRLLCRITNLRLQSSRSPDVAEQPSPKACLSVCHSKCPADISPSFAGLQASLGACSTNPSQKMHCYRHTEKPGNGLSQDFRAVDAALTALPGDHGNWHNAINGQLAELRASFTTEKPCHTVGQPFSAGMFHSQHNILQRSYEPIPKWHFLK